MGKFEGKRLLMLGNNISSMDIIRYAQSEGAYVIVTDYVPYGKSPAKQMADAYWDISTGDVEALYSKAVEDRVTAVFAGVGEFNLRSAMKLCKRMNLPFYATQEQWSILDDKKEFKKLCMRNGVSVTPEYYTGNDADVVLSDEKFPVIVKPVDGAGAVGIVVCRKQEDLHDAIAFGLEHSQKREVIVEKYLENMDEVTAHYVIQNGKVYLFGMVDRQLSHQTEDGVALPVAYTWNSKYLPRYLEEVNPYVEKMFASVNMNDGIAFIQMMANSDNFYVYEMGYRLPGSQVYFFAKEMYGVSQLELMVDYAILGTTENIDAAKFACPNFPKSCCNLYFMLKPGKIGRIDGLDEIRSMKGVLNVSMIRNVGDEIKNSKSLREVFMRMHLIADNDAQLAERIDRINATLQVYSVDGEKMLRNLFDTSVLTSGGNNA